MVLRKILLLSPKSDFLHHVMRDLGLPYNRCSPNYHAAIRGEMGTRMPKFNWRSLDDTYYDRVEDAEMTGIAWECLRRNASFQRDYQTNPSSGRSMSDGFRRQWGLVFRR